MAKAQKKPKPRKAAKSTKARKTSVAPCTMVVVRDTGRGIDYAKADKQWNRCYKGQTELLVSVYPSSSRKFSSASGVEREGVYAIQITRQPLGGQPPLTAAERSSLGVRDDGSVYVATKDGPSFRKFRARGKTKALEAADRIIARTKRPSDVKVIRTWSENGYDEQRRVPTHYRVTYSDKWYGNVIKEEGRPS